MPSIMPWHSRTTAAAPGLSQRGKGLALDNGPATRMLWYPAWHSAPTAEALARELLNAGPEHVVVKRGAAGAVWASRAEEADAVAGASTVAEGKVMTEPVWGTNTTGAGDSFTGYLLHGLATGRGCRAGVEAAVAAATSVARSGRGGQAALTD